MSYKFSTIINVQQNILSTLEEFENHMYRTIPVAIHNMFTAGMNVFLLLIT